VLPVSLECPFLIVPSVFSNIFAIVLNKINGLVVV
jgi:hypothetical protein